MITVPQLKNAKELKHKLVMVTCYDASFARVIDETSIDQILVGDSVAMVMHGFDSTLHATVEMMEFHTAAVARGSKKKFIVADMPFLSVQLGKRAALEAAGRLMRAGAHAVKIENIRGMEKTIEAIIQAGIPVVGHLGLTPQSVHQFGGMKLQGKTIDAQKQLIEDAHAFERVGSCSVVFECIPSSLGRLATQELSISTIGIGAGPDTTGQVLVLQDVLGFQPEFRPKFLKHFADGKKFFGDALEKFATEVRSSAYPGPEHQYSYSPEARA